MKDKYANDPQNLELVNAEVEVFRPTFVIDEEMPDDGPLKADEQGTLIHKYYEDEFKEMRIANMMFRQIGPCIRCKTVTLNWQKNIRHPQVRKHNKMGQLFGIYL